MTLRSRLAVAALCAGCLNAAAQGSPTLDRVAARGSIHLGYREAAVPFSYVVPGRSAPQGYTWDVCQRLVGAIESRVGKPLKAVPVPVTDNARTMLIKTGIVDLDCGAAANTVARQKQVAFSYTLYVGETRVLVRSDSGIGSLEQLAGKRIAILAGGIPERQVKQAALGRNIAFSYVLANSPAEAMAVFAKGGADAYIGDDATLAAQRAGNPDYRLLDVVLAAEPYGIMLPYGDAGLKQLLDQALAAMMQSGELAGLHAQWFTAPAEPGKAALDLPMSALLKAAIQFPNDKPAN